MAEEPQGESGEELPAEDLSLEEHDDSERAVASSMVAAWGYDRVNEQIEVSFDNGHQGSFSCTPDQWEEAKEAVSPGRFMWQHFL